MPDDAADEPSVLVEHHGGVMRIVPSRPARLDALDDALHAALREFPEATLQGRAGRSADHAGGVAEFLGKRAPVSGGEPSA